MPVFDDDQQHKDGIWNRDAPEELRFLLCKLIELIDGKSCERRDR